MKKKNKEKIEEFEKCSHLRTQNLKKFWKDLSTPIDNIIYLRGRKEDNCLKGYFIKYRNHNTKISKYTINGKEEDILVREIDFIGQVRKEVYNNIYTKCRSTFIDLNKEEQDILKIEYKRLIKNKI